jgi:hypothetical protein
MKRTNLLLIAGLIAAACAQAQTQAPAPPATAPAPAGAPSSGWEAALKGVTEACKGETPQLCPGLNGSTALACLQTNIDKVTPGCKDAVTKAVKSML